MSWSYFKKSARRFDILLSQLSQLPLDFSRQISILGTKRFGQSETEIPLEVLVVVHAYWPRQFARIIEYLNGIRMPLSIVVTIPTGEYSDQVKDLLVTISKHHKVLPTYVQNTGRDIGPFLKCIEKFPNKNWDLIIKVHTKASQNIWFDTLVRSLLKSDHRVLRLAKLLKRYPNGIIVHPFFRYPGHKQPANEEAMELLKKVLALNSFVVPKKWYFAAGSMFASSANVLIALKQEGEKMNLVIFEVEDDYSQSSLAHLYERFFGLYACARGDGLMATSVVDFFDLKALMTKLI